MKLEELMEEKKPGTYAGVRFDPDTIKTIKEYIKENGIPNGVPSKKMHSTLLYSKKHCPDYVAQGDIDPPYVATPKGFDVWPSQPDDDGKVKNCLVMEFDCPDLAARHKALMDEHKASYDFPDYKTHVTLSYDIGDMKAGDLPGIEKDLKELKIVKEYQEDLVVDWANK